MKLRKYIIFIILAFLLLVGNQSITFAKDISYRGELNDIAYDYYSDGDLREAERRLKEKESAHSADDEYKTNIFKAEKELLLGEIHEAAGEKEAYDHFTKARQFSEKALKDKETALAQRLYAEATSRLFAFKGNLYRVRHSKRVSRLLEESLQEKPKNEMTLLVQAFYYINAPGLADGDDEKGLAIFDEIIKKEHPVYNYLIYNFLADYEKDKENKDKMNSYLKKADKIFPDSPLTGEIF